VSRAQVLERLLVEVLFGHGPTGASRGATVRMPPRTADSDRGGAVSRFVAEREDDPSSMPPGRELDEVGTVAELERYAQTAAQVVLFIGTCSSSGESTSRAMHRWSWHPSTVAGRNRTKRAADGTASGPRAGRAADVQPLSTFARLVVALLKL
jgi:hypothetical protein